MTIPPEEKKDNGLMQRYCLLYICICLPYLSQRLYKSAITLFVMLFNVLTTYAVIPHSAFAFLIGVGWQGLKIPSSLCCAEKSHPYPYPYIN